MSPSPAPEIRSTPWCECRAAASNLHMNLVAVPLCRPGVARSTRGTAFRALLVPCQLPVRDAPGLSFDHLAGRRRRFGAVALGAPCSARLVSPHQPDVASHIGRQDGCKSALDTVLPRSGHGAPFGHHSTPPPARAHGSGRLKWGRLLLNSPGL